MKKSVIVFLIIIVLVAAAFFFFFEREKVEEMIDDIDLIEENGSEENGEISRLVINLFEQSNSGQSGLAIIESLNGSTLVTINVTPRGEEVAQPAHVHFNNCADIGGVIYPLNNVIDGFSETELEASLEQILSERPLSINVHKSVEEVDIYVACGDIL